MSDDIEVVVGIDPSLTSTGFWASWGEGDSLAVTLKTDPSEGTLSRIENLVLNTGLLLNRMLDECENGSDIVVGFEGFAFGARTGKWFERAGLWWALANLVSEYSNSAWVIAPKSLKKYATGSGNASKNDMLYHLNAHMPHVCEDDNQVDAAWLALAAEAVQRGLSEGKLVMDGAKRLIEC